MANWLTAVGFWEGQMVRRIFTAWRAQGKQKLLTALAHWESSQSGVGPAFRWWHCVVQHLHDAEQLAQQYRRQHACRAVFQVTAVAAEPPYVAFLHAAKKLFPLQATAVNKIVFNGVIIVNVAVDTATSCWSLAAFLRRQLVLLLSFSSFVGCCESTAYHQLLPQSGLNSCCKYATGST